MPPKLPEGARYLPLKQIKPTGGSMQISDVSSSILFSPMQPIRPSWPKDARPRQWEYLPGSNIIWQPKGDEMMGFWILREFADSCDLLRLIIETLKDKICTRKLEFRLKPQPGETQAETKARQAEDPRIQKMEAFWARPDGITPWPKWCRMLIEDMLVLDACGIYKERDYKGRIANLRIIDGGTLNRLITELGTTPTPPDPAYQQVLYGVPAFDFTTDDLTYVMRNPRSWKRYGYSNVEQCLTTIGTALRKQQFLSKYYTDGNMPEALCFLPAEMPMDQVRVVQDYFDTVMAGDLSKRRRLTFLPSFGSSKSGDVGRPNVVFPKEVLLKDELDDWLARLFAYNFGVPAQALLKMMNRATAETSVENAEEEGLRPRLNDILEIVNDITQNDMGFRDIEAQFAERRNPDPESQMTVDTGYMGKAVIKINEVREKLGMDPSDEPEADMLGVITPTGFVPLSISAQTAAIKQKQSALQSNKQNGNGQPQNKKKTPAQKVFEKAATELDPDHDSVEIRHARVRLETALIRVFRRQKDRAKEETTRLMKSLSAWPYGFTKPYTKPSEAPDYVPKDKKKQWIEVFNSEWEKHKDKSNKERERIAFSAANGVAGPNAKVAAALLFLKAKDKDADKAAAEIYKSIAEEWKSIPTEARESLTSAAMSGVVRGLLQVKMSDSGLISETNSIAEKWASDRAAELVGMKYNDDGELVENPNAKWAISDTTRGEIRDIITKAFEQETPVDEIADQIRDAGAFSDSRAAMIARTEVSRAQVYGNFQMWKNSGLVKSVRWQISNDNPCPVCIGNNGEIRKLGEEFPSGDIMPQVHPSCACILIAHEFNELTT